MDIIHTLETKMNKTQEKDILDLICKNYLEMDETGKEKLKEISKKLLEIRQTVRGEKDGDVRTRN